MKGVFVMNTSLHDILFMILDNELRRHYQEIAVKQGLCQVTNSDSSSTLLQTVESLTFSAFETTISSNFMKHIQAVFGVEVNCST